MAQGLFSLASFSPQEVVGWVRYGRSGMQGQDTGVGKVGLQLRWHCFELVKLL